MVLCCIVLHVSKKETVIIVCGNNQWLGITAILLTANVMYIMLFGENKLEHIILDYITLQNICCYNVTNNVNQQLRVAQL